jgi:hypothetical protein
MRVGNETRPVLIGRDGVVVADPFDPYREVVGEAHARRLDRAAAAAGDEIAALPDGELEDRLAALGGQPLSRLDRRRAAVALDWDRKLVAAEDDLSRAEEALHVWEARAFLSPDSRDLREGVAAWEEFIQWSERGLSSLRGLIRADPDCRYLHDALSGERGEAAAEAIAIVREQAIRAALARREPGVAAAVGERADGGVVSRRDDARPGALDELRPVIGERRAWLLERLKEPLARWARNQDSDWIRRRVEELGGLMERLDPHAARAALLAESRFEDLRERREVARAEARSLARTDPELAEAADREAQRLRTREPPRSARAYLDDWIATDGARVLRLIVYQDELELRRQAEIRREAERRQGVDPDARTADQAGGSLEAGGIEMG